MGKRKSRRKMPLKSIFNAQISFQAVKFSFKPPKSLSSRQNSFRAVKFRFEAQNFVSSRKNHFQAAKFSFETKNFLSTQKFSSKRPSNAIFHLQSKNFLIKSVQMKFLHSQQGFQRFFTSGGRFYELD